MVSSTSTHRKFQTNLHAIFQSFQSFQKTFYIAIKQAITDCEWAVYTMDYGKDRRGPGQKRHGLHFIHRVLKQIVAKANTSREYWRKLMIAVVYPFKLRALVGLRQKLP